ncbi:MAG: hypothetical protein JWM41_4269 [Gemmatimonadetes bacterium]|nr:hypothetical protein [Gemmatimonadota bacterium]
MHILERWAFRLRALLGANRAEREMDREMQFHVEMEAAQYVRDGVAPGEARRRALVAFGGRQRFREETRDEFPSRPVEDLLQDVRHAVRVFRRMPAFTTTVVLTLALGIGATTVIFSVTDHVVLRSLPYANADRLATVEVLVDRPDNPTPIWPANAAHFLAWSNGCTVCVGMAAIHGAGFTLTGAGDPTRIAALRVSDTFFSLLGVRAQIGRLLVPGDDQPGAASRVAITDALWRQQFGARTDILGRTITLNDAPSTVVGVLPPDFHMLRGRELGSMSKLPDRTDAFVPLALNEHQRTTHGEYDYHVIALLKPGVSVPTFHAQLDAIDVAAAARLNDDSPSRLVVTSLQARVSGAVARPLLLLLAAVGAMLLIMCVNLANLLLARSAARQRESAVRVALGAARGRLVRQALTETLLLALIGGLVGIVLSSWGLKALVALAPADLPRLDEVRLDGRVLVVAVGLSVLAGLSFGLVPAFKLGRIAPGDVLKEGGRAMTESRQGTRVRSLLIAAQVGLSALLLVAGGLFLKSFMRVMNVDKGFTADRVLALDFSMPVGAYPRPESRNQFYASALEKLAALPGVVGVATTSALPLEGENWIDGLRRDGTSERDGDAGGQANFRFVSPSFFGVLGVPIRKGRALADTDRGRRTIVLSERAAQSLWPNENPIGKHVHAGSDSLYEVVGIAADVRTTGLERAGSLIAYMPYWDRSLPSSTILLRTRNDPAAITTSARQALRDVAPSVPISRVRTIAQVISGVVAQRRFELVLIGLFALTALLTASIGIYGIISHSLGRRSNEIGIRIALGARALDVHTLVLREVLWPVALGLVLGVGASVIAGRAVAGLLFEVQPTDAGVLVSVALVLGAVATLACVIPSRRATRIDPVDALRAG